LNEHIAELEKQLKQAEENARQKEVEYTEMSNRLNTAMAEKIAELTQYQSEFYKQVKIALGNGTTVRPDGDRFIISSDILFPSGSYKITADGKAQVKILANIIKDFENKIPTDIDWIIRVDGHTDSKAVLPGTTGYKNNMELSLLRATAVVNELVKDGVSKRRLVPSGFGDLHPTELGKDAKTLQKNRRIELQLTNK
jgi:chemotaxis protein MotB